LLALNSPLNPTGAAYDAEKLGTILRLVLDENRARLRAGRPPLFVLYDQVYSEMMLDEGRHPHPALLVPEGLPWVVTVDAISKSLAATGLRVGWAFVPDSLFPRIRDLVCHAGAWAPTPVQVATARFLGSDDARQHRAAVRKEVARRMDALT